MTTTPRRPKYVTALGELLMIVPDWENHLIGGYQLVSFDRNGHWSCRSWYPTKEEAKTARTKMFRHHRKLAREYAARKRK